MKEPVDRRKQENMGDTGSEVKECWYTILGVERTASPEEIRSAYRKEALKWHPDKIQQSGASAQECHRATVRFQSIAQAYEVLGDPTERAWYDKHRNEILSSGTASKDFEFSVWSFFSSSIFSGFGETGKGFFRVYGDVFHKIHSKEQEFAKAHGMGPIGESPSFGSLHTDYLEVDTFYKFWQGFATIKDFSWCDEYRIFDARNRKERRLMEEENSKIRKQERREFNNAVRQLASFVKKRDKRVQEKQIELQRLQIEKEQQSKLRRQQMREEKLARARAYKEQEWAKISDDRIDDDEDINEDEGSYHWKNSNKVKKDSKTGDGEDENPHELYCIVCSKRFRSEKQWNNHEKSKKHIERASALKQSLLEEDEVADSLAKTLEVEEDESQEALEVFGQSELNECGRGLTGDDENVHAYTSERDALPESWHKGMNESTRPKSSVSSVGEEDSITEEEEEEDEANTLAALMESHRNRQAAPSVELESAVDEGYVNIQGSSEAQVEVQSNGGSEDSNDEEVEDDEESLLAAMMSSHRSKKAVSAVQVGAASKSKAEDDVILPEDKDDDSSSSAITDDENVGGTNDDDIGKSVLESMLKSRRSQGSVAYEERGELSEDAGVSAGGNNNADYGSEEEMKNSKNPGRTKTRRRSKQERQHLAAKERHDDILKELSSVHESSKPREEPAQKQKQVKQDAPVKLGVSDSRSKIEVVENESSKKGVKARGKKVKAAPKAPPPRNTCDTCGEDFESRNLLFRHITVTNHGSVKSK